MSAHTTSPPALRGDMTMTEVLKACPGAQRALFAAYHIGGCQSCGFSPTETLAQVCARNENLPVDQVIQFLQDSHQHDAALQITPVQFDSLRGSRPDLRVLDVRTREEHDAVHIPGSTLLTQDLISEIFATWDKTAPVILYDHTGTRVLDAVAYFIGHGFGETKALAGGIDAYSQDIDPTLPRYRIELEA